jgi:hypothetical protein
LKDIGEDAVSGLDEACEGSGTTGVVSNCFQKAPVLVPELIPFPRFGLTYAGVRRVTDGARTRDLLSSATFRTHRFVVVRRCSATHLFRRISESAVR